LVTEGIEFELETLDLFIKATYPDLRKCLNLLQSNSVSGTLSTPASDASGTREWRLQAVDLYKQGRVNEARKVICSQATVEDLDSMYRWMYDNLELWSTDPEKQDQAIVIIRNALATVPLVTDQEINLAACLIELANISK
jgi:replication factor C small subunit